MFVVAIVFIWYRLFSYRLFIIRDVFNQLLLLFGFLLFTIFEAWLGWKGVTRKHDPHILGVSMIHFHLLNLILVNLYSYESKETFDFNNKDHLEIKIVCVFDRKKEKVNAKI